MGKINEILQQAQARAADLGRPYQGELTPAEAYAVLQSLAGARLVDVRTSAEWDWVGRVPGALEIEWNRYPGGVRNPDFLTQLAAHCPVETPLLFLCRSGVRSIGAASAAAEAGYTQCYNILEGFEGDKDSNGQRGKIGGWRKAGLPWLQG